MPDKYHDQDWLEDQFDQVTREISEWPEWMRTQARFLGGTDTYDSPKIEIKQGKIVENNK